MYFCLIKQDSQTATLLVCVDHIIKKRVYRKRIKLIKRNRKGINVLFRELGPLYARRAYCMEVNSFWKINSILTPFMGVSTIPKNSSPKLHKNGAPNGIVKSSAHLSMALRFFAGGCPYDISLSHGVSHSTVYNSIERVVKAVNNCPDLNIEFPEDHKIQKQIASGFCKTSQAGFSTCIGMVDGVLIWIEKPTNSLGSLKISQTVLQKSVGFSLLFNASSSS